MNPLLISQAANVAKENKTAIYVVGGLAVCAVGFLGYKFYQRFIRSKTDKQGSAMEANLRDYKVDSTKATISSTQAMNIAQTLFDAMNKAGTDEEVIIRCLESLQNYDDLGLVIVSFGVRNYRAGKEAKRLSAFAKALNLNGWLLAELDGKELEKVAEIYKKLGWSI